MTLIKRPDGQMLFDYDFQCISTATRTAQAGKAEEKCTEGKAVPGARPNRPSHVHWAGAADCSPPLVALSHP